MRQIQTKCQQMCKYCNWCGSILARELKVTKKKRLVYSYCYTCDKKKLIESLSVKKKEERRSQEK